MNTTYQIDTQNITHQATKTFIDQHTRVNLRGLVRLKASNDVVNGFSITEFGANTTHYDLTSSPALNVWHEYNFDFVRVEDQAVRLRLHQNGGTTIVDPGGDDIVYIDEMYVTKQGAIFDMTSDNGSSSIVNKVSNVITVQRYI